MVKLIAETHDKKEKVIVEIKNKDVEKTIIRKGKKTTKKYTKKEYLKIIKQNIKSLRVKLFSKQIFEFFKNEEHICPLCLRETNEFYNVICNLPEFASFFVCKNCYLRLQIPSKWLKKQKRRIKI